MEVPSSKPSDHAFAMLWAKTSNDGSGSFHPLLLHLLDVAACADAVLLREPPASRERLGSVLNLPWEQARPWILLLVAAHDLGKASPRFQVKWAVAQDRLGNEGLLPPNLDAHFPHGLATYISLAPLLCEHQWPERLADQAAEAVGCHHGHRTPPDSLGPLDGCRASSPLGRTWHAIRTRLFEILLETFQPPGIPTRSDLKGPDFMVLAGLTSFTDWIGSNESWFTFGSPLDCEDPQAWLAHRRETAERALDAIGWYAREPLLRAQKEFRDIFPAFPPRPLQEAVAAVAQEMPRPGIILVEAPMGEGKTEAAFYAHLELQRRLGHRGMYLALPTKATGNAMFRRTKTFLGRMGCTRPLDLQLLHGGARLNLDFMNLKLSEIHTDPGSSTPGRIQAAEWFTAKKRALLSEYGVGTIDQALLSILPVRHNFVRLWGLANRVVVFDEIHAYDAYTGTLLHHLLEWLLALGSSVILLSATLPPSFRRELSRRVGAEPPDAEVPYPRLTIYQPGSVSQVPIKPDPSRQRRIHLIPIRPELESIRQELAERLEVGGLALALMNTVQRAQNLYRIFHEGEPITVGGVTVGKRLPDGLEVHLFHARFPADLRQIREDQALEVFGPSGTREGRKLLIATQVAEQSLDLDFDVLLTDLAPIDLLLQRAGRLWRHSRSTRPEAEPCLLVAGLQDAEPPEFGAPLWWGKIYRKDLLLRTWCLLQGQEHLDLPGAIDSLVQTVYEEEVTIPDFLRERMDAALAEGDGEEAAFRSFAHQAVIELGNWEADRFLQDDEDDPGRHPTLTARTRLGDISLTVVPVRQEEGFNPAAEPSLGQARTWSLRSLGISRQAIVEKLSALGIPEGWQRSPLLRHSFAMILDAGGRWVEDPSVRLDDELGLCFENKEAE